MLKQLTAFANEQEDIRVFAMNGSRVNPMVPDDSFKDFDVVFFTAEVAYYRKHPEFLQRFGNILLMTEPEKSDFSPMFPKNDGYIYLVQYVAGHRIDVQFRSLDQLDAYLQEDSLTQILLDKDHRVLQPPVPSDNDYHVKQPTDAQFQRTIKEFWWQGLNVLKAVARDELLLAEFYMTLTRNECRNVLTWVTALDYGFERSYGKCSHQITSLLPDQTARQLMQTYQTGSKEGLIGSLQQLRELMQQAAPAVAAAFSFTLEDDSRCFEVYLEAHQQTRLRQLLKSSKTKKTAE